MGVGFVQPCSRMARSSGAPLLRPANRIPVDCPRPAPLPALATRFFSASPHRLGAHAPAAPPRRCSFAALQFRVHPGRPGVLAPAGPRRPCLSTARKKRRLTGDGEPPSTSNLAAPALQWKLFQLE